MSDSHTLHGDRIAATILAQGAELSSLKGADGAELLWQAGSQWPRHAPVLFPIVGRLKNDALRHDGKTYPMTQHGFARDRRFAWLEQGARSCKLALTDDADTRARYPFAFRLEVTYRIDGADLEVTFDVINTGEVMLPASLGGHPAFNWPLLPELPKEAYTLSFEKDEPAPVRGLKDGLMRPQAEPSPIRGRTLALSERLFDDDAMILDQVASTSVRFTAGQGPAIEVSWNGFRELGIWSKVGGAPFLCIEPWHGFASPAEFDGEFADKPGLMHIAPGTRRSLSYRIRVS
ncbi:aldose 1-epimerase family protein [Bradyrhizobium sp. ISRA443]|uniref:aldose 1-epimerase family protein n=1 Tax=unclassified Bradyrhizobium TaxID=2631580 RepID=UPI00247888FE|nr:MULTISPECIES: aldose 1-epimerase family protein [unclassified Bradyrhizobium]WGR91071.1 aldose 1-epimerase family protein [Bradyrhizobium sp. ISRA435]WGS01240.1 aldose 1-epimerase family protein [Bradyrhizobium sp. ISRA436]WGS08127.1 aldose 1-epimerase family protein [Bradyrhizobium sp. ISRA437]WGS15015.1 aldose 1-epimerase family protein [Bradyrhizobium sp. ISRA443]